MSIRRPPAVFIIYCDIAVFNFTDGINYIRIRFKRMSGFDHTDRKVQSLRLVQPATQRVPETFKCAICVLTGEH